MRKKAKKKLKNIQKKIDTIRDKRCNAINVIWRNGLYGKQGMHYIWKTLSYALWR